MKKPFFCHCEPMKAPLLSLRAVLAPRGKARRSRASLVIHNQNEDSREMPQIIIASFALARRGDPYSALAE
ncbi:hypothetical protein [Helicobacter zhangjianzhongii]|uniref:hypothetical protein n=1 Tax=Helicobacter zhangjianzhongii TaxID=2974574 RepID=UPI0025550F0C|nr:hypothetical protein [Helicobacter sp. CPD2-1]MDL0079475.1 hypothetical protein [Helicobacter sp. CPD2-1]